MPKLFLTCEHGGNQIPQPYQFLFKDANAILATHRGYDIGALTVFEYLKKNQLAYFTQVSTISRLLVELNRSLTHRQLWSEFTRDLPIEEKKIILQHYYFPYRQTIENAIAQTVENGERVIHISVHSFTPCLVNETRTAEIGLLYDSRRFLEKQVCKQWQSILQALRPDWRIRCNYPYQGKSDGFTTYLRSQFKPEAYLGIELEMNQALLIEIEKIMNVAETIKNSLTFI